MSHYTARVEVDAGTLHVSRPLTAPAFVSDLVESVVFSVRDGAGDGLAVTIEVDTPDGSHTPIGDSIPSTSASPVQTVPVEDDPPLPADFDVPATAPAGVTS